MAPKRQKKAVLKTTRKVVKETVKVSVVEEEGDSEIGVLEEPPTRVVEVSVEAKTTGAESITVVRSPIREENTGEGKGTDKGEGTGEPVNIVVEQREEVENEQREIGEQSNEMGGEQRKARETERGKEGDKERKREGPSTVEVEQSKEAGKEKEMEVEQSMKEPENFENVDVNENRESGDYVEGDMDTQTPEERENEGEAGASPEEMKDQPPAEKRETTDEPEDRETEEAREPKTPKKVDVKPKKPETLEKRKRKRKKRNSIPSRGDIGMGGVGGYKTYVYRVLKQVHPTLGVSSRAMDVLDMMMADMFERLADEASKLSKYTGKQTISSREVHDAVRLVLPGELGKHAISEGTKAVSKYMEDTS